MLLDRTIAQLDVGDVPPERALEMGQLGFLQWMSALPGRSNYRREARQAIALAAPYRHSSPAIGVFCELVMQSLDRPAPVAIALTWPKRRGGASARRTRPRRAQ